MTKFVNFYIVTIIKKNMRIYKIYGTALKKSKVYKIGIDEDIEL